MAKYTEAELIEMVAVGKAKTFEKKIRCYLVPDDEEDVIYVDDKGTTLSDHLTLRDMGGVVYALEDFSKFKLWWKKVTGVLGGIVGILGSPLMSFVSGFTGWPVAKFADKISKIEALSPGEIEDGIRDEIGSSKGGRIILALEEAIKRGVASPEEAEMLGKLLGGND